MQFLREFPLRIQSKCHALKGIRKALILRIIVAALAQQYYTSNILKAKNLLRVN